MEPFRANLSNYRLSLVVPALFDRKSLTGTLTLSRGALVREFRFTGGFLCSASSNEPREHLAQVLCNLGILDVERSAAAFEAVRAVCRPFGAFLVERGFVDRARLTEALAHKAREAFFDCYTWESGELELIESDTSSLPGGDGGVELRIPLGSLHRDGLARLREWRTFNEIFGALDLTFRVHRDMAVNGRSEDEEALLRMAEQNATLGELLASAPEGRLFAARRVMQLYRRGVLSPKAQKDPKAGELRDVEKLMAATRAHLSEGRYEAAAQIAAQLLELAPIPEACALYRDAELRMALRISDEVLSLEGRLEFEPIPRPTPAHLTADDLYLYSLLKSARSVREALRGAAMGELAAYRSVRNLMAAGLIRARPMADDERPRRRTSPYGMPAIRG